MRQQIIKLLAQKGQTPVIEAINRTVQQFKQLGYDRAEIKETIRGIFWGLDSKVDAYILSINY